jgi:hypothetical protein
VTERRDSRGWGRVLGLALACIAFATVRPALLVFIPFGLLALGLPPRRPVAILAGLLLLGAAVFGTRPEGVDALERAWALLAGGWFLLAVVLLPDRGFVTRGLVAVGGAAGSAACFLAASGKLSSADAVVTERLRSESALVMDMVSRAGDGIGAEALAMVQRVLEGYVAVYPALLGLGTLAGLGVAWWGWGRLSLRSEAAIRPLTEFRFSDALVWLVILGVALVLLAPSDGVRAGSNLLLFMGALYALRGLAVAVFVWGMPGPIGLVFAALAAILLYPLIVATSAMLMLGLFDTWLDIRNRRTSAEPEP